MLDVDELRPAPQKCLKKEQPPPVFGSSVAKPVKQGLKNANRTSRYSGETNPHYVGRQKKHPNMPDYSRAFEIVSALVSLKCWVCYIFSV